MSSRLVLKKKEEGTGGTSPTTGTAPTVPIPEEGLDEPSLTAEQLRQRRLENLRNQPAAAPVTESPQGAPSVVKKIKPATVVQSSSPVNEMSTSPLKRADVPAKKPSMPAAPLENSPDVLTDNDEWLSEEISFVFEVKLPSSRAASKNLLVLHRLEQEMREDGEETNRLRLVHLDRIVSEKLHWVSHPQTASFCLACFRRLAEQDEKVLNKKDPWRVAALASLRKTLVGYALLALSDVRLLEQPNVPEDANKASYGANQLLPLLNVGNVESFAFVSELFRVASDKELRQLVTGLVSFLTRRVSPRVLLLESQEEMLREYVALNALLSIPRVCAEVVALPTFLPSGKLTGRRLDSESILGPFFSPSSYPDAPVVGDMLLLGKTQREEIFGVFEQLRHRFSALQGCLAQMLLSCLKNKTTRPPVIAWMVAMCNANNGRTFMRADYTTTSLSGVLLNFCAVCLQLFAPVASKLATVDPNYCVLNNKGVDFSACTRLGCDDKTVAQRRASLAPVEHSFNTEIFWITARSLSVGWRSAASYFNGICNALHERENAMQRVERLVELAGGLSGAPPDIQRDLSAQRTQITLNRKDRYSAEAPVRQFELLSSISRFYDSVCRWFALVADPDKKGLWPPEPRMEVSCLPDWIVDDLVFFFEWISFNATEVFLTATHHQNLLSFLVLLFSSEKYIHSPHLRGRLVDCMQCLIPNKNNQLPPDLYSSNKFAVSSLIPALLRFYIDCERTGGSNQFFDKFSLRYHISALMEFLWNSNRVFRDSMIAQCHDRELFLRFVTLLTNDANYLLDESLHKLEQIHELEKLQDTPDQWNSLSQEQQQEKREALSQLLGHTRSYNLLAAASVRMFRYLSSEIVEPFMSLELVDRLARMLDYFLVQLAGPKCRELKVRDPQALNFDPRFLLRTICQIFVSFGAKAEFLAAVAGDERSYKHEVFVGAAEILRSKIGGVGENEIMAFESFVLALGDAADKKKKWIPENIPDEFLDAITYELLEDPVTWPGSTVTCNRASIMGHLLQNGNYDPYNRSKLTVDMLIPDPDLKRRLDEWYAAEWKKEQERRKSAPN